MNPPSLELPAPGAALSGLLARAPLPQLSALAAAHGGGVYLVGGALRDAMLGRDAADLDIAVASGFEDFLQAVAVATGRNPSPIGDRWRQTHRLRWHGRQLDLALLLGPLDRDLAQRDFTVNAMALPLPATEDAMEGLVDPHSGLQDLKERKIRCVSEGVFDADPLRLLRAVRYLAALPDFNLDPATADAMAERAALLGDAAAERVQTEWKHLLEGERWITGIETARHFDLADRSFIAIDDMTIARAWSEHGDELELGHRFGLTPLLARLAAVLSGEVLARGPGVVSETLMVERWPARLVRQAVHAVDWMQRAQDADDNQLADWALFDRVAAALAGALGEARAWSRSEPVSPGVVCLGSLAQRASEGRWVSGRELRAWGVDEGPELGAVLAEAARGQLLRRWENPERAIDWARGRAALARQVAAARPGRERTETGE